MKFYFIRHGRMAGDPHAYFNPPVQGCLSQEGERQAAMMGMALSRVSFSSIFSSPLGRAIQTAQLLKPLPGVSIQVMDWLVEWRPAHVLEGGDPARYEEMLKRGAALRPEQCWKTPAGEGALEMAARLVPGWVNLLESLGVHAGHGGYLLDNPDDARNVALVAHGGSLGHLLAFVLGIPIQPHPPIQFHETGVAVVNLVRRVDVWYPVLEIPAP